MRLTRRAIDQRVQIMHGAGDSDILKYVAAGIHQRYNGAGQGLTKRDGGTHRHKRDCIDSEPPASKSRTIETASPATTGAVAGVQHRSTKSGRPAT